MVPVWRPAARGTGGTHTLDEAIGRSVIDRVSVLPRKKQVRLMFVLPSDELFDIADAPIAISAAGIALTSLAGARRLNTISCEPAELVW